MRQDKENPTVDAIVARLPRKPILEPRDIADAYGVRNTYFVVEAIQSGELAAVKAGNRYRIAREAAVAFVRKTATV